MIIPASEVRDYVLSKSSREGTAYIVRLTEDEVNAFQEAFPDKPLTPRYDPEKAREYRARKRAEAEAHGVTSGKLNL